MLGWKKTPENWLGCVDVSQLPIDSGSINNKKLKCNGALNVKLEVKWAKYRHEEANNNNY